MTAPWVSAVFVEVVNALPASIGLVAVTWLILRGLPGVNASTRYAAWWLCLMAALAAPAMRNQAAPATVPPVERAMQVEAPAPPRASTMAATEPAPVAPPTDPQPSGWIAVNPKKAAPLALLVWAGGVLFSLARIVRSYLWIRAARASARPADDDRLNACLRRCPTRRRVRLCWSGEITVPLAAGFFRPVILLPERLAAHLSHTEIDEVVIHELAHLARRDDWAQLAERCIGALFWFHPPVRWILSRIALEREMCCDDRVIRCGAGARSYAASLLKITELRRAGESLALASTAARGKPGVSRRIEAILGNSSAASTRISGMRLSLAGLALCLLAVATAPAPGLLTLAAPALAFQQTAPAPKPAAAPRDPAPAPKAAAPAPAKTRPDASPARVEAAPRHPAPAPRQRPPGLLGALAATGYADLSVDDIIQLKNNGVGPGFLYELHDLGIAKLPPQDLIRLRQHNVQPAYLREALASYPGLTTGDVIEFRNNGVKPALLSAMQSLGYGPYTPREVVQMSQHGVHPDFFQALKEYGIKEIAAADVIRARGNGVGRATFREARQYGAHLSISQIIKLKNAGVL